MFKKLIDIYPNWLEAAEDPANVLTALANIAEEAELNLEEDSKKLTWLYNSLESLALEYYGNHSGLKNISPLFYKLYEYQEEGMTQEKAMKLATIIFNKYYEKWNKLSAIYHIEYKPLEDYSIKETKTPFDKETTVTKNKVDIKVTDEGGVDNSFYGFNSVDAVKQNEGNNRNTQTTEAQEDNNKTTQEITKDGKEIIERVGGMTTPQDAIKREIDLWKSWSFIEVFFKDLDKVLCLPIY